METKIFVSYSRKNNDFVERLHTDLIAEGFDMWLDQKKIQPGQDWAEAIQQALQECELLLAILSPESVASREVQAEWNEFISEKKNIIPILFRPCKVPYRIRLFNWIDFSVGYEVGFKKLISTLKRIDGVPDLSNLTVPDANLSTQELASIVDENWNNISGKIQIHTTTMLGVRYKEKYDPSYYSQRTVIFSHFLNFMNSDSAVMVITGKAGTGKSSFICNIATNPPANTLVWLQDCAHLVIGKDTSIDDYIKHSLELDRDPIETFRELCLFDNSRQILLIFDAVNEFGDREDLLLKLSEFINKINTSNIKIIVTCRIPVWDNIKLHFTVPANREFHTAGPNSYVSLDSFKSEEIENVYALYQKRFGILTNYKELSDQVRHFISQPLFLKLTAQAYAMKGIPKTLILKDVFREYILRCLGAEGFDSAEYQVIRRIIELMYEKAQHELELPLLQNDKEVGQYITDDLEVITPFTKLVEQGLFSQKQYDKTMVEQVQLVFVTYERVFEFLLAEISVKSVDLLDQIIYYLDFSRDNSFVQLRGAVELALSFIITRRPSYVSLVLELARQDRPDGRQFLADVIQIIYDSGDTRLADDIVLKLSKDSNAYSNLLAVQVAYQLRLDERLVELNISDNPTLRDTASVYLYQRWNRARLNGDIEDAYKPINQIVSLISLRNPNRSIRALVAIASLSINLLSHVVDDPQSLLPLLKVFQEMVRNVPGLEPRPDRARILDFAAQGVTSILSKAVAQVASNAMQGTLFDDPNALEDLFTNHESQRALLDVGSFINLDNLVGYEEKLLKRVTYKNPIVGVVFRTPMCHHAYHQPDIHLPLLEKLFYNTNDLYAKVHIINAMTYSMVCRVLRGLSIPEEFLETITDLFIDLWLAFFDIDSTTGKNAISSESQLSALYLEGAVRNVLSGMFTIDAMIQKREEITIGSKFFSKFLKEPLIRLEKKEVGILLQSIEEFVYQGLPNYAILTMLGDKFREIWEEKAYEEGIKTIANMRAFYQEEIDSILLDNDDYKRFWNDAHTRGSIPDPANVFTPSVNLWTVAASVDMVVTKMWGFFLFELSSSSNFKEFIERTTKVFLTALFDFDIVNIGNLVWYSAHPGWDNFEKWEIDRALNESLGKTDIRTYYENVVGDFIRKNGYGIVFD